MIHTKVMRWTPSHRDHYVYFDSVREWHKVKCNGLGHGMYCTAPVTLRRGTHFDYNSKLSGADIELDAHGEQRLYVEANF